MPIGTYLFANAWTPGINSILRLLGIHFIWDADASRNLVNGMIALLIGGPHMYATFTRTTLDRNFSSKHKSFLALSLLVPVGVIYFGVNHFIYLLTFFFFWASLHVMNQVVYLMDCYDQRAAYKPSLLARTIDYTVVVSSLFPIATYRFVTGGFTIGSNVLYFPEFLRTPAAYYALFTVFTVSLCAFVVKTWGEWRHGTLHIPKTLFMFLTISIAFFVPAFPNLDVAFQGLNAWHSFQYLGLVYFLNRVTYENNAHQNRFLAGMSKPGRVLRFYGFTVGMTVCTIGIIVSLLTFRHHLGLSFDQCYYIVILSFLLMHYLHDHVLFGNSEAVLLRT